MRLSRGGRFAAYGVCMTNRKTKSSKKKTNVHSDSKNELGRQLYTNLIALAGSAFWVSVLCWLWSGDSKYFKWTAITAYPMIIKTILYTVMTENHENNLGEKIKDVELVERHDHKKNIHLLSAIPCFRLRTVE